MQNDFRRILKVAVIISAALMLSMPLSAKRPKAKYVIVVSMDGFRWDYPEKYDTPNLDKMALVGVSTDMIPSFPASTFPNHYALATGLVPDHNGLVNNSFWDPNLKEYYSMGGPNKDNPAFYLGEPIWNTAQRQGVIAGVNYWVSSEYEIGGARPRYYRPYDNDNLLSFEARTDSTLAFLSMPKKDRPRLIMLYFDEPDHAGHVNGPDAPEVGEQVARVDAMIGRLRAGILRKGLQKKVDLIVLADHGMTAISSERVVKPSDYIKPEWYEHIITGIPTSIFSKDAACRDSIYNAMKGVEHVHVWKKEEIPAELNYGSSERIGDIVVAPDLGWQVTEVPSRNKGTHGFFPSEREMQTVFRAEGPDFKKGVRVPQFKNVSIYPLVCWLLGIEPAPNDGDIEEVKPMLR